MRRSLALALALFSCGSESPADAPAPAYPHFTVRGRWDDTSLTYRIDAQGAPIDAAVCRRAIGRALDPWRATGLVTLEEAAGDAPPDVTFAWRRGSHDSCEPFGASTTIAHSGPVGSGTFVHFDAGRTWSEDGAQGESLFHTALHEIGHVLGLGHSAAPDALLGPTATTARSTLSASELTGLQSLYGGGSDGEGDLAILDFDPPGPGRLAPTLRRVAPPAVTGTATFDSDGDGDDEILIWRTDKPGNGALMVYHFDEHLELSHTIGPLWGMSAPGVPNLFVRTADGERLMVCVYAGGRLLTRSFDERGLLVPRADAPLIAGGIRDADGDGMLDVPLAPAVRALVDPMVGDLNGDGHAEIVFPIGAPGIGR